MSRKILVLSLVVALLLVTFVAPASAAHGQAGQALRPGAMTWSVPVYSLPGIVPGHSWLMCECASAGNCSC